MVTCSLQVTCKLTLRRTVLLLIRPPLCTLPYKATKFKGAVLLISIWQSNDTMMAMDIAIDFSQL